MIRFLPVAALACAYHDMRRQVREEGGENEGRAVRHMLRNADINVDAPWCAAAVQDWTDSASESLGLANPLDAVKLEALVESYADWARADAPGRVVPFPSRALPGDLVLFSFGGRRFDHIGMVVRPAADDSVGAAFVTIEGNTSSGEAGSQREGDGVYMRTRTVNARLLFVRWA